MQLKLKQDKTMFNLSLFLGLAVFISDLISKFLTQKWLPLFHGMFYPYRGIGVFKNFFGVEFSLVHATNKGAAWGLFADFQMGLLVLRIILTIALFSYVIFFNKKQNLNIPLFLIGFGALGNICDYFIYGHVIDMFHFVLWGYSFPVFNIADSAICFAIFLLFIQTSTKTASLEDKV